MDCLVAVPVGWDSRGPPSGHMPSAAAMQALAAHMPVACTVGSPTMRGTMYLPRLCSIPETEAECDLQAGAASVSNKLQETSCVQSAEACRQASVESSSSAAEPQGHNDCSSSPCSCCSSHEASPSAPAAAASSLLEADDSTAAPADLPAVVASTWAISIRHFTDCVPISADSVCSNSTCHAPQPAAANSGSARHHQQPLQAAGQQQQGCSSAPRTSSSSSLSPAAEDDDNAHDYSPPLSGSLSLSDMDALEWQPWDRVAKWLELNAAATGAAAAAAAAAASAKERPSSSSRSVRDASSPRPRHTASSAGAAASSHSRREQLDSQQEQEQQQEQQEEGGDQEALFDAPGWWQESVKARLEEQREAFRSSWFARLKISLGLAAQRASH